MSEAEIINILSDEIVSLNVGHEKYEQAVKGLLDLYNKEKEKNKGISKLEADLYECNNIISDYIDIVKQKDKIIDEILKTWKQDDIRSIAELKKYFEERCK